MNMLKLGKQPIIIMTAPHNVKTLPIKATLDFIPAISATEQEHTSTAEYDVSFNAPDLILRTERFQKTNAHKISFIQDHLDFPNNRVFFAHLCCVHVAGRFIHYYMAYSTEIVFEDTMIYILELNRGKQAKRFDLFQFDEFEDTKHKITFNICGESLNLTELVYIVDKSGLDNHEFFGRTFEEIEHDVKFFKLVNY